MKISSMPIRLTRKSAMDSFRLICMAVLLVFAAGCKSGGSGGGDAAGDAAGGDQGGVGQSDVDQGTGVVEVIPESGSFRFQVLDPENSDLVITDELRAQATSYIEPSVQFANSVAPLTGSNDIPIYFTICDNANASFDLSLSEITMCQNLLLVFYQQYLDILVDNEDEEQRVLLAAESAYSAFNFVLYHEIGHALHFTLGLGIAGNQESAADAIATVLAVEQGRSDFAILAAVLLLQGGDGSFGDVHSGGLDRGGDVLCWTLGGDPALASDPTFSSVVSLFAESSRDCVGEYAAQKFAVTGWLPLLGDQTTIAMEKMRDAAPASSLSTMDSSTKSQLSDLLAELLVGRI